MHRWWRSAVPSLRSAAARIRNNYHTIQAVPREITGPRISARDRAQGRIPTVVLAQNHLQQPQSTVAEKQLLTTESKQINSILKSVGPDFFCSTTFKLQIRAGSGSSLLLRSGNVLPIKLHRDEKSGKVMNMVLVWADQGSAIEVDVPLVFKGLDSSPGLVKAFHCSSALSSQDVCFEVCSKEQEVIIALGSNVGDRLDNFSQAMQLMKNSGINITRHGCLYETDPVYVTDQPRFLNSAVRGFTKLGPHELLGVLKTIEKDMGRTKGIRYGPRPIDLDILFYGKFRVKSKDLTVPHERIWERPFVMAPLIDLLGSDIDSDVVASWHSSSRFSGGLFEAWDKLGGEVLIGKDGIKRVLPVGNRFWDFCSKTSVMGILNLTPDSFSDGGQFQSVRNAISHVHQLISEGADIIDLGAQSTRPMATRISAQEELDRLIPVLEAVKDLVNEEGKFLSVDTFYSEVAMEAINRGAHFVNDVSGGQLDPDIHKVVAGLKVPYIAMHMRGEPTTMQNSDNLKYDDVCEQVALELSSRVEDAEVSGIPAWRIVLDPGIGFSKTTKQNLEILMGLKRIKEEIGKKSLAMSHSPLLVGPSRKKFLGEICDRLVATDRDPATIASITAAALGGADIVRVHNVGDSVDAVKLCDAMLGKTGNLR